MESVYFLSTPKRPGFIKITNTLEEDALDRIKNLFNEQKTKRYTIIHLVLEVENSKQVETEIHYFLRDYREYRLDTFNIELDTLKEKLSKYYKKEIPINKQGIQLTENYNDITYKLETKSDYYKHKVHDPTIITIVMLVFIFPFGAFLVWYYKLFNIYIRSSIYFLLLIYIITLYIIK